MCLSVLLTYMSVNHEHAWCPQWPPPKKASVTLELGLHIVVSLHVGSRNQILFLWMNNQGNFEPSLPPFYFIYLFMLYNIMLKLLFLLPNSCRTLTVRIIITNNAHHLLWNRQLSEEFRCTRYFNLKCKILNILLSTAIITVLHTLYDVNWELKHKHQT